MYSAITSVKVHTNGELDLRVDTQDSSFASIYVFSADVDTRSLGQVFYRESSDPQLLESTRDIIGSIIPALSAAPPTSLFIATWFYVGYFDNNDDRVSALNAHAKGMLDNQHYIQNTSLL